MIEEHGDLKSPTDDAVLWRFMDFTKYVTILDTSKLYFTQAKRMEDNYEGLLPRRNAESQRKQIEDLPFPPEVKQKLLKEIQTISMSSLMRESCYLSCWHMNPHESAAMWKLYLSSNEGVAVRTTFAAMKRAFANTPDVIQAAIVQYIDYTSDQFSLHNGFIPIIHKRLSFAHESEIRLIWWSLGNSEQCDNVWQSGSHFRPATLPGRQVAVSVGELISEVFVSPTSQQWFRDLVESVTRKYGFPFPVIKSNLYSDPVW
jgi:hypothetical protein